MRRAARAAQRCRSAWRGRSRMQTTRSEISAFFARARFRKLTAGSSSRSTRSSGKPPPTAILSMYTSGALRKCLASAIAITASALAPPLAVIVVPSSGSSAMSIGGPLPVPTFSPIKSIGASSQFDLRRSRDGAVDRARLFSASRIASTAAWSAAFLVAAAHQSRSRQRRRLRYPDDFQCQIAVHSRRLGHDVPPRHWSADDYPAQTAIIKRYRQSVSRSAASGGWLRRSAVSRAVDRFGGARRRFPPQAVAKHRS